MVELHRVLNLLLTGLCLTSSAMASGDTMRILSYKNSRTILLLYGEEHTIECGEGHGETDYADIRISGRQFVWHFGDTKSVRRIRFDANGRFAASPTDSGEFQLVDSNGYSIAVRASGYSSVHNMLSFSRFAAAKSGEPPAVGPNGVLACSDATSHGHHPDGARTLAQPRVVFHLMLVLPLMSGPPDSGCPLPGYRLGSFAGRAACHPCLPGEFAPPPPPPPHDRRSPACLPCRPGFESPGFASSRCVPAAPRQRQQQLATRGRTRRSANDSSQEPGGSNGRLQQKRLPLASFTVIIMYHFLMVLVLSVVVFLYLMLAAFSFANVWSSVMSATETEVAAMMEDMFVLDQPAPEDELEDSD